ncbi:hypothetical protein Syun_021252 [Stephania yunnanensis]|uniref:Uncharacterized protein n=1 Tax=Stephania yunnanensis TaxID=152371 RepID=A0AAP0IFQ0_9MAGN
MLGCSYQNCMSINRISHRLLLMSNLRSNSPIGSKNTYVTYKSLINAIHLIENVLENLNHFKILYISRR